MILTIECLTHTTLSDPASTAFHNLEVQNYVCQCMSHVESYSHVAKHTSCGKFITLQQMMHWRHKTWETSSCRRPRESMRLSVSGAIDQGANDVVIGTHSRA
jgi:hypothetical protein